MSEEIRWTQIKQQLSEKVAEIERLELKLSNTRDDSADKDAEIERLHASEKRWSDLVDKYTLREGELKAEIESLNGLVKHWSDAASKYEHKISI